MYYRNSCQSFSRGIPLIISKIDSTTGNVLAGAAFQLTDCRGCRTCGMTNDAGVLVFCVYPCNSYTLAETTPPVGFAASERIYSVNVDHCGCIYVDGVCTDQVTVENIPVTGAFTAVKVNAEDNTPLAGATYTLFQNSAAIANAVSSVTGAVGFANLPAGTYELVETAAPAGFQLSQERIPVTVAQDGSVLIGEQPADGFVLGDVPLGSVAFQKQNALTGLPLEGAAFQLTQNGAEIAIAVSDTDGLVDFGVITPGTYELVETAAPDGFQPDSTIYPVTVGTDGAIVVGELPIASFVAANTPVDTFTAVKVNIEDDTPLAGAAYTLQQDSEIIATAVSNTDGEVTFTDLPPGTYELLETTAPDGFQLNTESMEVVVSEDGGITIMDEPADGFVLADVPLGSLSFLKVEAGTETPVSGAVFGLSQNGTPVATAESDEGGLVDFGVISPGNYELVETEAPDGYQTDSTVYQVVVGADGSIIVGGLSLEAFIVGNIPVAVTGSFTATKVNIEDDAPLAGAAYSLVQNSEEITRAVSNADGEITFAGLLPGDYELVEVTPPEGFQVNGDSLPVTVAQDGTVTIDGEPADDFVLEDIPLGAFVFEKTDESTGLPLADAVFQLSQGGDAVDTATSDGEGQVDFGVLLPGTYELEEIEVPGGFQPNTAVYEVVVGIDGTILVEGSPLDEFTVANVRQVVPERSAPPVIDNIVAGAVVVTGTGISGSSVEVTFPSGTKVTTTVDGVDTWAVDVPSDALTEGQQVSANQTEVGKQVSDEAFQIVIAPN